MGAPAVTTIDRARLSELMERERACSGSAIRRSRALFEAGRGSLLWGVPMNWMVRWPGDHPVYVAEAHGARFTDVDGNDFVDFCLGDTGGMAGHAPEAAVQEIARQAGRGITQMLPDGGRGVGERRARPPVRRSLLVVHAHGHGCEPVRDPMGASHHRPPEDPRPQPLLSRHRRRDVRGAGSTRARSIDQPGNTGPPVPVRTTTRVVEINDVDGLARELAHEDVAVCVFEPALTNIGIVLPGAGILGRGPRDSAIAPGPSS